MNFRTTRHFKATRTSTFIAVVFSIASGASTLTDGKLVGAEGDSMQQEPGYHAVLEKNAEKKSKPNVC